MHSADGPNGAASGDQGPWHARQECLGSKMDRRRKPMIQTTADTAVITKAIQLACRAPSLHNSQPWRWIVHDTGVDLCSDHRRVVRSADNSGREALISCGAALGHFRAAMTAAGWDTKVDQFPNPRNPHHLPTVLFTPPPHIHHP